MKYEVSCLFCGHSQIYSPRGKIPPKRPHTNCKKCGKDFLIDIEASDPISKVPKNTKNNGGLVEGSKDTPSRPLSNKSHVIPPNDFIDDPNELLMDCAIRELNKQNPEVRWASILINILDKTKQLEAISKDRVEVQSKLKQYSTIDLISLRKKLTGNLQTDG